MTPQELEQAYEAAVATGRQVASSLDGAVFKYPCGRAHVRVVRKLEDGTINPFYQYLYKRFAKPALKEHGMSYGYIKTQHGEPHFGDYPRAYVDIYNPASGQSLDDYITVARAQLDILTRFGVRASISEWID